MCAIMGFSKKTYTKEELLPFFDRTRSRGPDMSQILWTGTMWSATARSTASAP